MSLFEDIKTGLNEAIEYENENLQANTSTLSTETEGVPSTNESNSMKTK